MDTENNVYVMNEDIIREVTTTKATWGAAFKRKFNTGDPTDLILIDGSEQKVQWLYGYTLDGYPTTIDANELPNGVGKLTFIAVGAVFRNLCVLISIVTTVAYLAL